MEDLTLRQCTQPSEIQACVAFQKDVWGEEYVGLLTPAVLWFLQQIGGIAIGAFNSEDHLQGMVLGATGLRDGVVTHWSHMLAVRPHTRNQGLAYRLKMKQREVLLQMGVRHVMGTFDPLNAAMASLLLNRLGAIARRYIPNAYPGSVSPLHQGIGTDRLISEWTLDPAPELPATKSLLHLNDAPLINPVSGSGTAVRCGSPDLTMNTPSVRIAIPLDIVAIQKASPLDAMKWRLHTRTAFEVYLGHGYSVEALRCYDEHVEYLLVKRSVIGQPVTSTIHPSFADG